MAFKATLFYAQALLIQLAYSQCFAPAAAPCGRFGPGLAGAGLGLAGAGLGLAGSGLGCGVASSGGGFAVSSASSIPPVGVSVVSETNYEGPVTISGNLPLLGTIGLEGVVPTAGASAVSYGCGDGAVGIAAEEGPVATGIVGASLSGIGSYGPGLTGVGSYSMSGFGSYGPGIGYGRNGCGCGAVY